MHLFRVWAPNARTLDVIIDDRAHTMTPKENGWWAARVENAGPGTDYFFSVDGADPMPDPRSEWQPFGVHGPSRVVDHSFDWSDRSWQAPPLESGLIYELHIGTFTPEGTFDSAIGRLPYLKDLGVTHVEVMPVNEFSGRHGWGYDGVDLFAPCSSYGGPARLKRFVDACHRTGLAVLIDVIYNHFGPSGNYLSRFGPYTTDAYPTPWGPAVNLDGAQSSEVRRFFIDNALFWLREYHADGLRLDAVHALIDHSACHLLEELSEHVDALERELDRRLVLIAESDLNDPRVVTPRERGGHGIDAQWSDDFHHALHAVLTGEYAGYYSDFGTLEHLAKALRQAFVYDGTHSAHRQRPHGRAPRGLSGHRFLAYIQNHDQIGNRAQGERISHLVGPARTKVAAALVLTSPFIPMLFQGEEWAASAPFQYFTGHEDEHLGRVVSEGRRSEFSSFGWAAEDVPDPQDPDTYSRSKLDWRELDQPCHREILDWYRSLIRFRQSSPDLLDGDLSRVEVRCDDHYGWLTIQRGRVFVACNFADADNEQRVRVPRPANIALRSEASVRLEPPEIVLPPESVALLALS